MAYVRTRTSKNGVVSTTLVEAYRDHAGRPRQRVLANLRGEPDALKALAKLAAMRKTLRQERDWLTQQAADANDWYAKKVGTLSDKNAELVRGKREEYLRSLDAVEAKLSAIEREGAIVKKHCTAAPEEIQAAIKAYRAKHKDALALVLGMEFIQREQLRKAKAALRRLER